ncbi:hypothetical protein ACH4TV_18215 [Streptomyces sp. NPDC020898]|uniref:hypothetical protein n=1 Tax=Streptomyces sp. NPDC020898 TaxID=3365101 RepID=UPI003796DB0C
MRPTEEVEKIAADSKLSVSEKEVRIIELLSGQPDRGVAAATMCLMETGDDRAADFAALYLALLPGAHEEKARAAERLRGSGQLVRSASRLVPWLPGQLLDSFVTDYVSDPKGGSPLSDVIFEIGVNTPDRLRPFADRIESHFIHRSLLSGSPDELVDAFLERWREGDDDYDAIEALALIRTRHAARTVLAVREEFEDPEEWEILLELAGILPDAEREAGYRPPYMGLVTDDGESPHVMGGHVDGPVPVCPACSAPAQRVLTLAADAVPYGLAQDPSFFWYTCSCGALETTTVRVGPGERYVFYGPHGISDPDRSIVPGKRSMTLESHPNRVGVSLEAIAGWSRHQVGGLPRWVEVDAHPHCPECRKVMPFLASIDSGPTPFGAMGFRGTLFCFWCNNCRVSVTQHQS